MALYIKTLVLIYAVVAALLLTKPETMQPITQHDFDRTCLAMVAFTEARSEGVAGMAATIDVVMNRTHDAHHRWPTGVCAATTQSFQFSGVQAWSHRLTPAVVDGKSWRYALALADAALDGERMVPPACGGATHFDTGGRSHGLTPVCKYGAHTFYKEIR